MVGPNCLGVINTNEEIRLNATFAPTFPAAGRMAFMSQSGGLGVAIIDRCQELGLGISTFVSVGNKADVSGNDLLEYWEHDPDTDVVLLYLESFGNPRKFTPIARRMARHKPIIVVKAGRTASGQRAASSHTGALAGIDVAADALFRQAGVIRTDTLGEMFDTAMVLLHQPVPRGKRTAILTNAGGPGILAADACEELGLLLPELAPDTVAKLRSILPDEASTSNPVDMVASATADQFLEATRILLAADEVDILLTIFVPPIITQPEDVAEAIAKASEGTGKPVVSCLMGAHGIVSGHRSRGDWRVPSFKFPEAAARAMARVAQYGEWLRRPEGREVSFADADVPRARAVVDRRLAMPDAAEGAWLHAEDCRELLTAFGIRTAPVTYATTPEEASAQAAALGFPVVVKLASDTITHKSDVRGVRLDLRNEAQVSDAFYAIRGYLADMGLEDAMTGVNVQPMIEEGVEAIVGVTLDPAFGPLIMFGLGGIFVELLQDVTFRLHPITDLDAAEMVRELKAHKLLDGYRSHPPADVPAVQELLLRVSALIEAVPEIREMDFNPVKLLRPGQGATVVDARVRLQKV
jgi:acyl-CoA synthetase (NDP forming)